MATRYMWNHRVHEMWGESRLCIWRLKFNPTFTEKPILDELLRAFADIGVRSYAVYELLGYYDILIRIWLPNAIALPRMEEHLGDALFELDYEDSEYFEVSRIVRHWVWQGPDDISSAFHQSSRPIEPETLTLASRPDSELVERVNRVANGHSVIDDLGPGDAQVVNSWIESHVLRPLVPADDGFKYFVIIKRPSAAGSRQARKNLVDAIAKACDKVSEQYEDEISFYEGSVEYLVTGRFDAGHFHEGMQFLLDLLNESGLSRAFLSRTFTAVALHPTFLAFQDELETRESIAPPWAPLEEALLLGESDEIEFKSSAYAHINRWLHDKNHRLVVNDDAVPAALAKAVCGMLNSRLYGTVVVGVGERSRLVERINPQESLAAEEILDGFPADRDLVLFGTAPDLRATGLGGWDEYVRMVQQSISSTITPDPAPFLRFERGQFMGVEMLVIRVAPPSQRDWFYVEGKDASRFFVRFTGMTRELRGADQDSFKRQRGGGRS